MNEKEFYENLLEKYEEMRLAGEVEYRFATRVSLTSKGDSVLQAQTQAKKNIEHLNTRIQVCKDILKELSNGKSILQKDDVVLPAKGQKDS